ncbi:MAG TPA: hypothetical protein VHT28_00040, partial [Silvibacterium sp.]|nr:hypothetical protein [Silvibacterium sp.]
ADLNPRRYRHGAAPHPFSNQVRDDPAAFAMLNLVDLKVQDLSAPETAASVSFTISSCQAYSVPGICL